MTKINIQSGQSLLDIALQYYGSIEAVFQLADDNGIDNITDNLIAGTELIIDENMIIDKNIVNYYKNNAIYPANEVITGVGYMAVGVDFIIS